MLNYTCHNIYNNLYTCYKPFNCYKLTINSCLSLSPASGYRLPHSQGRSASASADVGSGRDLLKKFMLFRGLFPTPPPQENVIVISPPTPTYTSYTPSTTTTTFTITNSSSRAIGPAWRNLNGNAVTVGEEEEEREQQKDLPDLATPTVPTLLAGDEADDASLATRARKRRRQRPNSRKRSQHGQLRKSNKQRQQQQKQRRKTQQHKKNTRQRQQQHKKQHQQPQHQQQRKQRQLLKALAAAEQTEMKAATEAMAEAEALPRDILAGYHKLYGAQRARSTPLLEQLRQRHR